MGEKCIRESGATALEKVEARRGGRMDIHTMAGSIKIKDTVLDECSFRTIVFMLAAGKTGSDQDWVSRYRVAPFFGTVEFGSTMRRLL